MKPFNVDLYARSAEKALRRIAVAKSLGADDLRSIAREELHLLKIRYRYNGYIEMQPDQNKARARPNP